MRNNSFLVGLVGLATIVCASRSSIPASVPTTTAFNPSTCSPSSIAACPTSYDPCCAFICAEAQVPFQVCSPEKRTVLAQCSQCPFTIPTSPLSSTTKRSSTITTPPTKTSLATSTCTGRLLSTAGCPASYDPCCAWVCEEAQVPYDVCSQTDGTGEYATCSKCPTPTPRL